MAAPQHIEHRGTTSSSNSGYIPGRRESKPRTGVFLQQRRSQQPKLQTPQISPARCMKRQTVIHTHTQWSIIQPLKDVVTRATIRMELENIALSEITQKNKYCMTPLKGGASSGHIHRQKVEWLWPGAGWGGNGELWV